MINSTLGGLIKDYRLQKGISQLDIAFALGWKESSRLSRIEQGRTEKPTRKILDKIIKALDLEKEEENFLLLTAGHLPTEEEIQNIKKETAAILNEWPYPAALLDFSWRAIDQNQHMLHIHHVPSKLIEELNKHQVRVLDLHFSKYSISPKSSLPSKIQSNDILKYLKQAVLNFKYEQRHRTKEKWYVKHVKTLMENELFRKLWTETNMQDSLSGVLGKHTIKKFISSKDPSKILSFYMFILPVLKDPRFEVELYVPMDLQTYQYFS